LAAFCALHQTDWDLYLPDIAEALRSHVVRTGYTPYYLVFGQHPKSKLDSVLDLKPEVVDLDSQMDRLEEAREFARMAIKKAQSTQKKQYDKGGSPYDFKRGDYVLLFKEKVEKGDSRKLSQFWTGPMLLQPVCLRRTTL